MANVLNDLEMREEESSITEIATMLDDLIKESEEQMNDLSNLTQVDNSGEVVDLSTDATDSDFRSGITIDQKDSDFGEGNISGDLQDDLLTRMDEIFNGIDDLTDDLYDSNDLDKNNQIESKNDGSVIDEQNCNQEERVDLETVEDDSVIYEEVVYPCLIIRGVTSMEEIDFIKRFRVKTLDTKSIYVYIANRDNVAEIGYVELTIDFLLVLEKMPSYKVSLLQSKNGKMIDVDLHNPNDLVKFISI